MGTLFRGDRTDAIQNISLIAYNSRGQVDIHTSKIQILDLNSVDPTNVKEIFGKHNIFQPLLQSRAIFEMIDSDGSGGWVVDGKEWLEKYYKEDDTRAYIMYIIIKIQSINVVAL